MLLLAAEPARGDGRVYHVGRGRPARALDVVARLNVLRGTELAPVLAGPCSAVPPAARPDVTRARVELGFSADVDLGEGLRRRVEAYRASAAATAAAVNCGPQLTANE